MADAPTSSELLTPPPVDAAVGRNLRALRKSRGMSQEALARSLGLTFQQVQKYERGANRISASKLYDAAAALGVEIAALFAAAPGAAHDERPHAPSNDPAIPADLAELARQYARIPDAHARRLVRDLAAALADAGRGEGEPRA